jgi:hypothetical protein
MSFYFRFYRTLAYGKATKTPFSATPATLAAANTRPMSFQKNTTFWVLGMFILLSLDGRPSTRYILQVFDQITSSRQTVPAT